MKKMLGYLFIVALLGAPLMGCNTFEGAGEDIEEAGDEIEEATD